ncbi:sigma-70 family RNA polymerase sigma factor [Actinomadura sp. 1N219]|uniref:sigma-70 family RNA polymerase sigma factor n=1 Tax=Actinomadura sp. 1N219 TaxID=3375152 RepID=UPI003795EF7D
MNDDEYLAARFERHRPHLRKVAYRLLGSPGEADDALQEAWLRVSRAGADEVENLPAWLTTIVARVALNMLKSRSARPEGPMADEPPHTGPVDGDGRHDPEGQALLADSVGLAMLVVLDTLTPAERLAFVLHDVFSVPFSEIAPILERNPAAVRQLASRARRRVRGASADPAADPARQRHVVDAFLLASQQGDLSALVSVLHPDVVLRADRATVDAGLPAILRGAADVAGAFSGRAQAARPAFIDGVPGLVWAPGGRPRTVFAFTVIAGEITEIRMISDPDHIALLDIQTARHG